MRKLGPSALLRAGFDRLVLSIPAVSLESLRTNGWDIEGLSPNGLTVKLFLNHYINA